VAEGIARILFVWPHNIAGEIVDFAEGVAQEGFVEEVKDTLEGVDDDPAHVAIITSQGRPEDGPARICLLEAVAPKSKLSRLNKYDGIKTELYEIPVPNIDAAENLVPKLVDIPYGLATKCVSGMIYDLTGYQVPIGGDRSANCSGIGITYLREGGYDPLTGVVVDCITPSDLRNALRKAGYMPI
jgi:hypothetical protein